MNKRRKATLAYIRHENQCTLQPEEPPNGGISKDFSPNFTPNRFQTGRLSGFGVKFRLFGGDRGWRAHQRPPAPTSASHARHAANIRHTINARYNRKSAFEVGGYFLVLRSSTVPTALV
ncbi:hypothetical protein [Corynebacterium diphtheriae]|uniref:hypothetical protein n=1 Tax=Corynebacterium diphtheriae TaxID=1717 RepID=UPI0015C41409|nr:hypothetical protein [Corynebacterium diphtheriae]